MKKITAFVLQRYSKMSGDKKVRLGLSLSKMVREVRMAGVKATGS